MLRGLGDRAGETGGSGFERQHPEKEACEAGQTAKKTTFVGVSIRIFPCGLMTVCG